MVDLKDYLVVTSELYKIDTLKINDLVGKGFEYGSKGPEKYDCYTLCQEVCKRYGVIVPDFMSSDSPSVIHQLITDGKNLFKKLDSPKSLSIIAFKSGLYMCHIGTLLNFPYFIHVLPKCNVIIERVDSIKWKHMVEGYYAVN
jgi:hypothetical protein